METYCGTLTFHYILQNVTHPRFKVRRPDTLCFRLDTAVTSQGVPFIVKKMCHRNHMAKIHVTINLSLVAISGWCWTFFRFRFDWLSLNITLWNRERSVDISSRLRGRKPTSLLANSDRRKRFFPSSQRQSSTCKLPDAYAMNTEGPFHEIKSLRLRWWRPLYF